MKKGYVLFYSQGKATLIAVQVLRDTRQCRIEQG